MNQVLTNLVGNAVKFTERGSVCVSVGTAPRAGATPVLRFAVEDTGIGISSKARGKLFNSFTQADESISRRFGGTGLGLAICRELVTLMGGEIDVTSTPGEGSCFFFTMPNALPEAVADASTMAAPVLAATKLSFNARVLVVDDGDINREVAGAMLAACGCVVSYANNGREAIDMVCRDRPDLVMMDCHMPVIDGFHATAAIRGWERSQTPPAHVPIVAVSASVLPEDRERCAAAGMSEFLAKPLSSAAVAEVLRRLLTPSGGVARSVALQSDVLTEPLFDFAQFQEMRAVAGDGFADMLQRFAVSAQEQLLAIRAALLRGDAETLREVAHKLKGTAATLGARGLMRSCACLEEQARTGQLALAAEDMESLASQCIQAGATLQAALSEEGPIMQ